MIVPTVASILLYISQLFVGSIVRESNDFTLPSLGESNTSFVNSLKLNNVTDMKRHGRLSKWSATNKARFLVDLDAGKAGDWIVGEILNHW